MANDTTYRLKVQPLKDYRPAPYDAVQSVVAGEYVSIRHMQNDVKTHVRRLNATQYQVIQTGAIKEYQPMDADKARASKRAAVSRTMEELRALIRANFNGVNSPQQLMVTLTYREHMTDPAKMKRNFQTYSQQLSRHFPGHQLEYIAVAEPHGTGRWHMHVLLKTDRPHIYISPEQSAKLWPHGFSTVRRLKGDDAGAYYAVYFTTLLYEVNDPENASETSEEILKNEEDILAAWAEMTDESVEETKAHMKSSRLHFYPKGMRLYRCSQGITRPEKTSHWYRDIEEGPYERIFETACSVSKVYEEDSKEHGAGEMEELNKIYRATYRRKRRK